MSNPLTSAVLGAAAIDFGFGALFGGFNRKDTLRPDADFVGRTWSVTQGFLV